MTGQVAAAPTPSGDGARVSLGKSPAAELTILTKDDPADTSAGRIGYLFSTAPDSAMRDHPGWTAGPETLLGSIEPARAAAATLARALTADEPIVEGVRQLSVFQEVVQDELTPFYLAVQLDRWLSVEGISVCRFLRPTPWAAALTTIQRLTGSSYQVRVDRRSSDGMLGRGAIELLQREGLRRVVRRAARRAWPLSAYVLTSRGAGEAEPGGWWFYTTGYNYTRAGLAYEPYMPRLLTFLVEDETTGGRALQERGRPGQSLYSYCRMADLPSRGAVAAAAETVITHVNAVRLEGMDSLARDHLLSSSWFSEFWNRLLPLGLLHSRIAARWLERVRPQVLVVGNTAFEGYLLQPARAAQVPTVLLQHGMLGEHCKHFDEPADHLVVTNRFSRDSLAPETRGRAVVLGLPQSDVPKRREGHALLFITLPWCQEGDLQEILRVVARTAARAQRPLIVRVHPVETIESYRRRFEQIVSRDGLALEIEYSQGGDPSAVVRRCAAAVLFWSTMFIDCVRWGVPVVSPGWHDFHFKSRVAPYGIFRFASSLAHLADLVAGALDNRLGPPAGDAEAFDAPTTDRQLKEFFSSVVAGA